MGRNKSTLFLVNPILSAVDSTNSAAKLIGERNLSKT